MSVLTLLALALTIALHMRHGLNPFLNLGLNSSLGVLWAVSFALLAWWAAGTLGSACVVETWETETGVRVCRAYKALFSFAALGLLATLGALGVDVHVQRCSTSRGGFVSLGVMDGEAEGKRGGDVGWDANPNPAALRGSARRGGEGYKVPDEQWGYEDTAYTGAAGQVGRRSMEDRL